MLCLFCFVCVSCLWVFRTKSLVLDVNSSTNTHTDKMLKNVFLRKKKNKEGSLEHRDFIKVKGKKIVFKKIPKLKGCKASLLATVVVHKLKLCEYFFVIPWQAEEIQITNRYRQALLRKSDTLGELVGFIDGAGHSDLTSEMIIGILDMVKINLECSRVSLPAVSAGQALPEIPLPRHLMGFHVWESRPLWREVNYFRRLY